jgi:hypothetical protein
MGDGEKAPLRLQLNPKVRLEFHGSNITSDAGLMAFRELDDALDLTGIASNYLQESRTGRNILHHLVPLLRQSIYSRLAGYDDTNDAVRLSKDPDMRVVVACSGSDHNAASTSEMGRFETETLTDEKNLKGLAQMNSQWVEGAMVHTPHRRVILDMDSSESPVHGRRREPPTTATSSVFAIILSFCSTSSGIAKQRRYDQATATVPIIGKHSLSRW